MLLGLTQKKSTLPSGHTPCHFTKSGIIRDKKANCNVHRIKAASDAVVLRMTGQRRSYSRSVRSGFS